MLDFRCLLPENVRQRDKLGVERCGKSQLFGFQAEKSRILTSRRDFTLPCGLAEGKQPISARRSWVGYCKLWGPRSTRMACPCSMMFYMKVSWNRGTPKSSILVGFSLINHPAIGYSMYGTPPIWCFSPGRRSCHCTQSPRSMVWSDLAEAWWAVVTRTPVGPLKHGEQRAMFFICSRGSATVLMRRRVWGPQNKSICLFAVKPWC